MHNPFVGVLFAQLRKESDGADSIKVPEVIILKMGRVPEEHTLCGFFCEKIRLIGLYVENLCIII